MRLGDKTLARQGYPPPFKALGQEHGKREKRAKKFSKSSKTREKEEKKEGRKKKKGGLLSIQS